MDYGLHWFRRDLRMTGNPALLENVRRHDGRVLGIFFFDSKFLARPDFSHARFAFFMDTLHELREAMRKAGGDLLVLDSGPDQGFTNLIRELARSPSGRPSLVTFNRDYEPFARERDSRITSLLETELGVATHTDRDHLLIEPREIVKAAATRKAAPGFYQVYTPFARRWFETFATSEVQSRLKSSLESPGKFRLTWQKVMPHRSAELVDRLEAFREENARKVTIPIPGAGAKAVQKCLREFSEKLTPYKTDRDYPGINGTSHLSLFLKNGSVTIAQVIATLGLEKTKFKNETSVGRFVKELAWREFYYHILWHCPWVEHEAFLVKYRHLRWENRKDHFEAWAEGRTGFPIVDAGMRQLKQTGWMHNRVRMIVASFLVKDLLIDWRWGEKLFMERLLDGDLAPNNGGWQWAASTGCDPQPYFRIFNPTLQSLKFDAQGEYIKRWVPERAQMSGKGLHEPIDPIVDHAERKKAAIALFRNA